jgi:ATP-dependent RNA helicase DeaD
VRLAVGRNGRAEPRWLLPMLCRAGDLTRDDIGAIRIFEDETLAQIHADAEARFFNALGATMQLEGQIAVERSAPPAQGAPRAGGARPPREERKPGHRGQRPDRDTRAGHDAPRPKRDTDAKGARAPRFDKDRSEKPRAARPDLARDAPRGPREARADAPRPYARSRDTGPDDRKNPPRRDHDDNRGPRKPRAATGTEDRPARREPARDRPAPSRDGKPPRGKAPQDKGYRDKGPRDTASRGKPAAEARSDRPPQRDRKPGPRSEGPARSTRRSEPAAPARPDRTAALDPSARLDRPGAKPRATARTTAAKGGKPKPGAPKGKPRPRSGPGADGTTPPFRPRRG